MGGEETESRGVEDEPLSTPDIELVITDEIRKIGDVLSKPPFEKDAVFRRGLMFFDQDHPIPPEHVPGFLVEMHISSALERFASRSPTSINLNPILNGERTERYLFERTKRGSFTARPTDQAGKIAEYDRVVRVDRPVVIEGRSGLGSKGAGKSPGAELWSLIKAEDVVRRLTPLKELFGESQFGFIVVASPEAVDSSILRQRAFEERGALLVPFPLSAQDLDEHAREFSSLSSP
jgi:hypothetical protein